jgi:hypothetical protein
MVAKGFALPGGSGIGPGHLFLANGVEYSHCRVRLINQFQIRLIKIPNIVILLIFIYLL